MTFFDKLGETITSKSKDIAKKAKEVADIATLKSQVSNQQDIVNRAYIVLGKAYYNENKNNPPTEYEDTFKSLGKALEKIEQLKNDIQIIKGTDNCPNCNAQIAKDAVYCSECGIKVEPDTSDEAEIIQTKNCPHCGMITDINSAFCTGCGEKLNIAE
ncbi:MAG: hypothetical protein K0S61_3768 [Anaerocolumna sp.]|jgi:uncharacterized protein with PIN domain|nr:hypothetical protein [Anaerocolumna sp.]